MNFITHRFYKKITAIAFCLLTEFCSINAREITYFTIDSFSNVIQTNNAEQTLKFIRKVNINAPIKEGLTLLHIAVAHNAIPMIKLLIKEGADVNAKCNDGNTPLHIATELDLIEAAQLLINADADINIKNHDGYTALDFARHATNKKMCELLKNSKWHSFDEEELTIENKKTDPYSTVKFAAATMVLATIGYMSCQAYSDKIQKEAKKQKEIDCAQKAAAIKKLEAEKLALNLNDPDYISNHDLLHEAVAKDDLQEVERILSIRSTNNGKVNVNRTSNYGNNPLFESVGSRYRISHPNGLQIIKRLIDAGTNVNSRNREGNTLLIECMLLHGRDRIHDQTNYIPIMQLLIDSGIDINAKNGRGRPTLSYAKNVAMLEFLVKNNANVHAINPLEFWDGGKPEYKFIRDKQAEKIASRNVQ